MKQLMTWIILFLIFYAGFLSGGATMKGRAYIPDWSPRIPYKQFFEEERKTSSPINTVYIKNWSMYIETVDGNFDIIPLDIKYRGRKQ